jgi:hypothetical protein
MSDVRVTVEECTGATIVGSAEERAAALQAERTLLLARLAEIDAALAAIGR